MLFALIGFYRDDAEDHLMEISADVNEFLGPSLSSPRLAGVLRSRTGRKIGNLVIINAESFQDAEIQFNYSPALNAGLYERTEVGELYIEVGDLNRE